MIAAFDTARLQLRPLTMADVDDCVGLNSDPDVMRYLNGGKPEAREVVATKVQRALGYRWAAIESTTDAFIGWFSLKPSDEPNERELGYRLQRTAWGRGYATEGSCALITYAFNELGVQRVWAQTMTVNTRSRRVMERCGLRYVRTFFGDWPEAIEGSEQGDVEYEITREAASAGVDAD